MSIESEIKQLAKEKNAIILAHNYQNPEIQDIADITGDSLELARTAAKNDADIIVFCGVHFMAESAKILSPQKKVLLPAIDAGCPMADMAEKDDILEMRAKYPNAKVVTYINSTADSKSVSDVICTSSNAVKIVKKIDADELIFIPDKNLGHYVSRFTDKKIIPWQGFCPTHERFTVEQCNDIKQKHPDAILMVHPECQKEVVDSADEVLSTGEMVKFVQETDKKKIIVGTEVGMIHKLTSVAPHIEYIKASDNFICHNMKKIDLEKLKTSLEEEVTEIFVDETVADKAKIALQKMLELS